MALFGGARDVSLIRKINRELMGDIITQQCSFYKYRLEETSRTKLLEKKANEAEFLQKDLASSPYTIYIG